MPISKTLERNVSLHGEHKDVESFVLEKWERAFKGFFDANANTEIDHADFYVINRHVRDIYGADSDQMRYAKKTLDALWEGLLELADKDKDQKVQLEEWVNVLKKAYREHKEPKWFHEFLIFMFKLFDVSGDDIVDLAEYTDGMSAFGCPESDSHAAFKIISVNSAGKPIRGLDMNQFKQLWLDYFFSKDKNALGNHLFGVLDTDK